MTRREVDGDAIRRWKADDAERAALFERWLTDAVGQPLKAIESVTTEERHGQTVLTVVHRVLNERGELQPAERGAMHTRTVRLTLDTPPPTWPPSPAPEVPTQPTDSWPPPAWPPPA